MSAKVYQSNDNLKDDEQDISYENPVDYNIQSKQMQKYSDISLQKDKSHFVTLLLKFMVLILQLLLDIFIIPFIGLPFILILFVYDIIKLRDSQTFWKNLIFVIIAKSLDLFQTVCVFGLMYYSLIFTLDDKENDIYTIWCQSCALLFIQVMLYFEYTETDYESNKDFGEFIKSRFLIKNISYKGIWSASKSIYQSLKILNNIVFYKISFLEIYEGNEFHEKIKQIQNEIKIDDSIFFYGYLQTPFNQSDQHFICLSNENQNRQQREIITLIRKTNKAITKSGYDSILKVNYDYLCKKFDNNASDNITFIMVFICVIIFKFILPLMYLELRSKKEVEIEVILIILGFYLFLVNTIYVILSNQDLRRRRELQLQITQLINFDEFGIKEKEYYLKNKKLHQQDRNDSRSKLDITNALSLETWDNSRKIALEIDMNNSRKFDLNYVFLGFYYIFLTILCINYYGGLELELFEKNSNYNNPLILMHSTIDFIFLTVIFLQRIYHGGKYNEIFQIQKDHINYLIGMYNDLIELYDIYFKTNLQIEQQISNDLYLITVDRIKQIEGQKALEGKGNVTSYMRNIKRSLHKLIQSIDYDYENYEYKLFGFLTFEWNDLLLTIVVGLITILPFIKKRLVHVFTDPDDIIG